MRFLRPVLLAFGFLCLLLVNHLLWADIAIFNSDNFANTVEKTIADPQVQERIATVVSQQAADEIDLQPRLEAGLPDNLKFLARFATDDLEQSVIFRISLRLLGTEFAGDLSKEVVQRLHSRLLAILEGEGSVKGENGQLVLDLRPVVDRAFERLGVDTPARVQAAQDKGAGVIVLVDDTEYLDTASSLVQNRNVALAGLLILAVLSFGAFVLTGPDRTSALSRVGFALAGVGLLTLLIVFIANQFIPSDRVVLESLVRNFEVQLKRQSIGLLILGAVLVCVTETSIRRAIESGWQDAGVLVQRFGAARVLLIGAVLSGLILLLVS